MSELQWGYGLTTTGCESNTMDYGSDTLGYESNTLENILVYGLAMTGYGSTRVRVMGHRDLFMGNRE